MKMKKTYERPATAVTHVELESPICVGSPDMTAESPNGATISPQEVNTAFKDDNSFGSDSWDPVN